MTQAAAMKSKKRNPGRFGRLVFFTPIVVLAGVFVFLLLNTALAPTTGTLHVEMRVQEYNGAIGLQRGTVTVDGVTTVAPSNLTLPGGFHRVAFPVMNWYYTPLPESVNVLVGQTAFAYGVYHPISEVIAVSPTVFNNTKAIALHGVTPLVFLNTSDQVVTLQGTGFNTASLNPGQSFTFIYPATGTYSFNVLGNPDISGQVKVS